jgi:hypothetical protein
MGIPSFLNYSKKLVSAIVLWCYGSFCAGLQVALADSRFGWENLDKLDLANRHSAGLSWPEPLGKPPQLGRRLDAHFAH